MDKMFLKKLESDADSARRARLTPVHVDDLLALRPLLKNQAGRDPYMTSPAYLALTGRSGLWKIQKENTVLFICRHPNLSGEFLIFPSAGKSDPGLLQTTLKIFSGLDMKATLARMDADFTPSANFERVKEETLDWAFPVHILDTEAVIERKGNKFQNFRTHLGRLDSNKIEARDFDIERDYNLALTIINEWAEGNFSKIGVYVSQLELFDKLSLSGRIIFYAGMPAGLSLWEETDPENAMANAYTHLALHQIDGLSRYVMLDMCESLKAKSFRRVCIGGSETEGLDRFKRKLCPAESIYLSSYAVKFPPAQKKRVDYKTIISGAA